MELSHLYAVKIADSLAAAVDMRKVAEAWIALHPPRAAKAIGPELSAFLARIATAIRGALKRVLGMLWPEATVLGQQAAEALAGNAEVDWAGWEPGDYQAALKVAGASLRRLLADQDVRIKSIADSRLEELGDILADYIASDVAIRPDLPEPLPPQYSVEQLASELRGVLSSPQRALMVAQTEVARASSAAAGDVFRRLGVGQVEVSTAADARVCPKCAAAEAAGPVSIGAYSLPLHPMCRCALIPVIPSGAALAALGGAP